MPTSQVVYNLPDRSPRILAIKSNGGTVTLEVKVGSSWLLTDTYTADTVVEIYFGHASLRISPTGGAEFELL